MFGNRISQLLAWHDAVAVADIGIVFARMPLLVLFGQGDCPLKRRQSHQVLPVLR